MTPDQKRIVEQASGSAIARLWDAPGPRKSPPERQTSQGVLPLAERQAQHEQIGVRPFGQQVQPDHGNRHDKQAHQHEIQREGPAGGLQVTFVVILHHQHLKHPRQADEGRSGQQRQRGPTAALDLPFTKGRAVDLRPRLHDAAGQPPNPANTATTCASPRSPRLARTASTHTAEEVVA